MSGDTDKVKGRIKQAAGALTDNDELTREGKIDEGAGKAKDKVDDAIDTVRETVDKAAKTFSPKE